MLVRMSSRSCSGLIAVALASLLGAGCESCEHVVPKDAGIDTPALGAIAYRWKLEDASKRPIRCDQLDPNASIEARLDGASSTTAAFQCRSCGGTTDLLAIGGYTTTAFRLQGESPGLEWGPVLGTVTPASVVVAPGAPVAVEVKFVVNPTGKLALRFSPPGGCAAAGDFRISLFRSGAGCEPVTFARSGGASTAPYKVDCSAPSGAPCLEPSETLTAESLPSGNYQIRIRIKKQTLDAFTNDDQFLVVPRVPVDRVVAPRVLNLAPLPSGAPDAGVDPPPIDAGPGC
jgi:hypothetical protein